MNQTNQKKVPKQEGLGAAVLTVLVAGHREERLKRHGRYEENKVKLSIESVLGGLEESLSELERKGCSMRVLTGDADGVDAFAAAICHKRQWPLQIVSAGKVAAAKEISRDAENNVVLGVDLDDGNSSEQRTSGATQSSVNDAVGEGGGEQRALPVEGNVVAMKREKEEQLEVIDKDVPFSAVPNVTAYTIRDDIALAYSDILLVVWDGHNAKNLTGGSVYLVFRALQQRKPVIWIDLNGNLSYVDLNKLSDDYMHSLAAYKASASLLQTAFVYDYEFTDSVSTQFNSKPVSKDAEKEFIHSPFNWYTRLALAPWELAATSKDNKVCAVQGAETIKEDLVLALDDWKCVQRMGDRSGLVNRVFMAAVQHSSKSVTNLIQAVNSVQSVKPKWLWFLRLIPAVASCLFIEFKRAVKSILTVKPAWAWFLEFVQSVKAIWRHNVASPYVGKVAPSAYPKGNYPCHSPEQLLSPFCMADIYANISAERHRSGIWLLYLLAAIAVFAAVMGSLHLFPANFSSLSLFWGFVEFGVLLGIYYLYRQAKKHDWHTKWLKWRFVAEQLRYSVMGFPIAAAGDRLSVATWSLLSTHKASTSKEMDLQRTDSSAKPLEDSSVKNKIVVDPALWLIQYFYKQQGLPKSTDGTTNTYCPTDYLESMFAYVHGVIDDQRNYHHKNHEKLEKSHHRLHMLTNGIFVLAFIAVVLHLILHSIPYFPEWKWLLLLTAALPALGAAIHGITTSLEFVRVASQSQITETNLQSLALSLSQLEKDYAENKISDSVCWVRLRELSIAASEVMSDTNAQWAELLSHNKVNLPA